MARGVLRIYLGAAPGVGKTYAMLNEGWRRAQRGLDVVIGYLESHGRINTAAQARELPMLARAVADHRGTTLEEMDLDAVLARRPALVLVDELAHTNAPGMRNEKRWQDVEELLASGIDVITTLNVQHLESLNDVVTRITGVVQRETVPDSFVRSADQVELVDMSPEALRRRMAHGNIYPAERVDAALANYFRPANLAALRELALLWVADRVEESLQDYLAEHGIGGAWETRERVVVALTGAPGGDVLVRRAARIAGRTKGDLVGVHVAAADGLARRPGDQLDSQRSLLIELGGTYREVVGDDVGAALTAFAVAEQATQLVLGATRRSRWAELLRASPATSAQRRLQGVDLHIIDTTAPRSAGLRGALPPIPRHGAVPVGRERLAWVLCAAGLPLLTWLLVAQRSHLNLSTVLLLKLTLVLVIAAIGGVRPGVVASVLAFGLANWFLTPPFHTLTIGETDNIVALAVFVTVALGVSVLVDRSARRSREVLRARAEAQALARTTGAIVSATDPLPQILDQLRTLFGADSVMVLDRGEQGWVVNAVAGPPAVPSPTAGTSLALDADGDTQLVLVGAHLSGDDLGVLRSFTDQLALGLEARRLRREAEVVESLEQTNALRAALLQAVSHDLRTPLASIKASVSGLLEPSVSFTIADRASLLTTIDAAADRLDQVIGNLLDMSRLQAGAITTDRRPTPLEEVVAAALTGVDGPGGPIRVDVPVSVPLVLTDPALLERAVANIVSNALAWSPPGETVRVEAAPVGDHVELRVVDRGPGIPPSQRSRVFEPFQRLGDRSSDAGVGLGLAIARGFVEATGARLEVDDTPGGGTTMTVILPVAPAAAPAAHAAGSGQTPRATPAGEVLPG